MKKHTTLSPIIIVLSCLFLFAGCTREKTVNRTLEEAYQEVQSRSTTKAPEVFSMVAMDDITRSVTASANEVTVQNLASGKVKMVKYHPINSKTGAIIELKFNIDASNNAFTLAELQDGFSSANIWVTHTFGKSVVRNGKTTLTAYDNGVLSGNITGHIDNITDLGGCKMIDLPCYNYAYTDADVNLTFSLPIRNN